MLLYNLILRILFIVFLCLYIAMTIGTEKKKEASHGEPKQLEKWMGTEETAGVHVNVKR